MTSRTSLFFALTLVGALSLPQPADAQRAFTGYELLLDSQPSALLGDAIVVSGTAFRVQGFAELTPLRNGNVTINVREYAGAPRPSIRIAETETVRTDSSGRFTARVRVPGRQMSRPSVQVRVGGQGNEGGRAFDFSLSLQPAQAFDLLVDRRRFEPGESAHVWARLHEVGSGAPLGAREVELTVTDPRGATVLTRTTNTEASGVYHAAVELPQATPEGTYNVLIRTKTTPPISARANFVVGRRTVERLMATFTLDQRVASPTGRLTGNVRVLTPSGTPVHGASVTVRVSEGVELNLQTRGDGRAALSFQAPAYLQGDMAAQQVVAQATHPAHGAASASARYMLARVPWRVQFRAENGGLVPETEGEAFVLVTDPLGEPAPAGMRLEVRGDIVRRGSQEVTLDARGMARVAMNARDGMATRLRGGDCAGQMGMTLQTEIATDRPLLVDGCVAIATEARVRIRAEGPLYAPGALVPLRIDRHPSVRGATVQVEALRDGRIVASTFASGGNARLEIPDHVVGMLLIRARPLLAYDTRPDVSEAGSAGMGAGSLTSILVRPADAFAIELESAEERWQVRDRATIALRTSAQSPRAWAAYVVRDLAAHGGEVPWRTGWMRSALDEALMANLHFADADDANNDDSLFLEASLAASQTRDVAPAGIAPLVPHPWDAGRYRQGRRLARDAVLMRGEMRSRGAGALMMAIESSVSRVLSDPSADRSRILNGRNFRPDLIERLVDGNLLPRSRAKTLGDGQATVAMLRELQPGFTFDMVARRIARQKLVALMAAVVRFSNPDDQNAARASSGYEPENWLSRMVQLGIINRAAIIDPWGNTFALRRSDRPRFVLSARAPRNELVSAGPDGRLGTGDDISDPFARAIPENTPYSVASGEDRLMKQLSMLSPGPGTLNAMASAYSSVSLAVRDEQMRTVVTGSISEGGESFGLGGVGMRGGGGAGADMMLDAVAEQAPASAPMPSRTRASARAQMANEPIEAEEDMMDSDDGDGLAERSNQRQEGPGFSALNQIVRERFPATLHFVPEIALDGTSTNLVIPLADALTTYRVEAVAWTASGWLVNASTEIRVDQDATIDAPVPPFASVGDVLRLPVRVTNRTNAPLTALVRVVAEDITLTLPETQTLEIAGNRGVEHVVEIRLPSAGTGAVRLEVVRPDGSPLDAIRRPLKVWEDARLVHIERELLTESGESMDFVVPSAASSRGPAGVRISPASLLFGDPLEYAASDIRPAWLAALMNEPVIESQLLIARRILQANNPSPGARIGRNDMTGAAVSVAWSDAAVPDEVIARGLRALSMSEPGDDVQPGLVSRAALDLRSLVPALRSDARPALRESLTDLTNILLRVTEGATSSDDAPALWADAAFALALHGGSDSRARELVRRAERHIIRVGDEAFLEEPSQYGIPSARIVPSAHLAGAYVALGRREQAIPFLRSLVGIPGNRESWNVRTRLIASSTAALVAGGRPSEVELTIDGNRVALSADEGGVFVGEASALSEAGEHRIVVRAGDAPALAFFDVRYGMPWSASVDAPARIDIEIEGQLGARDTRAGISLVLRNREARLMTMPVAYIDIPSGGELEEDARERLRALCVSEPTIEGRTLRLPLRPLAPGGMTSLPLPIRWSVGGELHGLGVSVYDEADVTRRTAVLPSRVISLPNEGPAPEIPDAESVTPPSPNPEPPHPIPFPIERMAPLAFNNVFSNSEHSMNSMRNIRVSTEVLS